MEGIHRLVRAGPVISTKKSEHGIFPYQSVSFPLQTKLDIENNEGECTGYVF